MKDKLRKLFAISHTVFYQTSALCFIIRHYVFIITTNPHIEKLFASEKSRSRNNNTSYIIIVLDTYTAYHKLKGKRHKMLKLGVRLPSIFTTLDVAARRIPRP